VLRGNGADLGKAAEWYREFLELRRAHGLDEVHEACEARGLRWSTEAMPYAEEVAKVSNTCFDETKLRSPKGDLVWYDAMGDTRPAEIVANWDHYFEFTRYMFERRTSTLDRLSHEDGRLVKIIRVMDCEATGFWLMNKEFQSLQKTHLRPLLIGTSIEVLNRLFIINMPWWATKVWVPIRRSLPARLAERTRVLGRNFLEDEEFMNVVGPALATQLLTMRRSVCNEDDNLEGGPSHLPAGRALERALQVGAGQLLSWEFTVGLPSEANAQSVVGSLLDKAVGEASDVLFSVRLWPDAAEGVDEMEVVASEQVLAGPERVSASEGRMEGSIVSPCSGTAVLRWSNQHSWVRTKLLSSFRISI